MLAALLLEALLSDMSGQTPKTEPGIPPGPLSSRHTLELRQSYMPVALAHSLSGAAVSIAASLVTHLLHSTEAVKVPHPGLDTSTTGQRTF